MIPAAAASPVCFAQPLLLEAAEDGHVAGLRGGELQGEVLDPEAVQLRQDRLVAALISRLVPLRNFLLADSLNGKSRA
jgi:hypothetical protein